MKLSRSFYLFIITLVLAAYYVLLGVYLNKCGYANSESLFYAEKARILTDGVGNRLKVMGLTAPILPFYGAFVFAFSKTLAPVLASALGTAMLFYIMAITLVRRNDDDFYLLILLAIFLLHPGILFTACSGKSIYMVLIFFYLFFFHIIRFYQSNTTFHVSIASICLVMLVFCDYKFIWLTLFFIPLVLFIAIQSLNLGEKESIFRLFLSFNNPALRRKLINKTFAVYIILFILPLASVVVFKLLNLTHANDLDYFIDSPYSTWTVLADRLSFDQANSFAHFAPQQAPLLVTGSIVLFCPMILIAIYLFRQNTYHILTILTPFAFIEFLQIKYDKIALQYEYFLIFLVLSLLCFIFKSKTIGNQVALKIVITAVVLFQLYTGYTFLEASSIADERSFISVLLRHGDEAQDENKDMANFINGLPAGEQVMMDDAIAYPVIAYTENISRLTLPYQNSYISASEAPEHFASYILIATDKNPLTGYTQLNSKYLPAIKHTDNHLSLQMIYETDSWALYKIL